MLPTPLWRIESVVRLLVLCFLGILAANLAMGVADKWLTANVKNKMFLQHLVSLACMQGLALLWVTYFLREHGTTWKEGFGLGRAPMAAVRWALAAILIAVPMAMVVIGGLIVQLMKLLGQQVEPQATVTMLQQQMGSVEKFVIGLGIAVLAPVAEETLFRGILYPTIKHYGYPRAALWSTSVLFALVHFNLPVFIPLIFLALVFTWLFERTGNLLAPIVAHAVFNGVNFWFLVSPPKWLEALQ